MVVTCAPTVLTCTGGANTTAAETVFNCVLFVKCGCSHNNNNNNNNNNFHACACERCLCGRQP
eukprot:1159839-Pelagomonas_calceolata.AAC.8